MAIIDSLVAYYKMDEGSGNIVDAHGSNDGTAVGNPTYGQTGIIIDAIDFDGDDYFNVGTMGSFGSNLEAGFSISFWIKTTSEANTFAFGTFNTGNVLVIDVRLNQNHDLGTEIGGLALVLRDDDGNKIYGGMTSANQTWRDGSWHHLVFTADGDNNTLTIWIDGNSQGISYNAQTTPDNFGTNFDGWFGVATVEISGSPYTPMVGELDEIGIWNKILDSTEIGQLYNGGSGLAYPFTVAAGNSQMMGANF